MRTLLACLVAAVLALGAWLTLRSDPLLEPSKAPSAGNTDASDPARATPVRTAPDTAGSPLVRESVDDTSREAAKDAPPIPADAQWLELLVVDALTEEPAPDVDVWWSNEQQWPLDQTLPRAERNAMQQDDDLRITRFGWHARTDRQGRVRVTPGESGAAVIARDATRFARGDFAPKTSDAKALRLALQREQVLTVHVTDATGADAQGVPVLLWQQDDDGSEQQMFYGSRARRTDATGTITFPHLQRWTRWSWGPHRGRAPDAITVAIVTPGIDSERTRLDPEALPSEPVELQLPPTGHLTLHVLFEGQPIPDLEELRLHADPNGASELDKDWVVPIDEHGTAQFRHVPLGKTFVGGSMFWSFAQAGPTAPGQLVEATIDVAELVYALSGRVLDDRGAPVGAQNMVARFQFVGPGGMAGGSNVAVGGDGRFLWLVHRLDDGKAPEIGSLRFELLDSRGPGPHLDVDPRQLHAGRNELGDLRFVADPLVVAGRLVFDCDQQRYLTMRVERFHPEDGSATEGSWRTESEPIAHNPGRAEFEVRGDVEPGRLRLAIASYDTPHVEPVEFTLGATDLEILVRCGNAPRVTCLLPEELSPHHLRVVLEPSTVAGLPPAQQPSARLRAQPGPVDAQRHSCSFGWHGLADGTYTLRIEVGATTLVEVPEVVLPLADPDDPRLRDIDLRELLASLQVRVSWPADVAPRYRELMVFVLPQPEHGTWHGMQIRTERDVLPVPRGPVDLLAVADGMRPETLRGVEGEVEITPQPWPSAELTFFGIEQLPSAAKLEAGLTADPATPDERTFDTESMASSKLQDLLHLRDNGMRTVEDFKVTLQHEAKTAKLTVRVRVGGRVRELQQVLPAEIELGHPSSVQLSAEELQQVVAELQAQGDGK
ncbi:MAG: hypothetical protein R3F29_14055 [Planctomycetota bacterium]